MPRLNRYQATSYCASSTDLDSLSFRGVEVTSSCAVKSLVELARLLTIPLQREVDKGTLHAIFGQAQRYLA
jgi:hypothetical protein